MKYSKYLLFLAIFIVIFGALIPEAFTKRWYQKHSVFYEKIPTNPELDPNSANYINYIVSSGWAVRAQGVNSNDIELGHPVYFATDSTPTYTMLFRWDSNNPPTSRDFCAATDYPDVLLSKFTQATCDNGWHIGVPLDSTMKPAAYTVDISTYRDRAMTIIRLSTNEAWELFGAYYDPALQRVTMARRVKRFDLTTDGIFQPDTCGQPSMASRSLLQGMLFLSEIVDKKYIEHALTGTIPWEGAKGDHGIYPMRGLDSGHDPNPWALRIGHRLQLNPSIDFTAPPYNDPSSSLYCDPVFCQPVAKALQEYGIFIGEGCGDCTHLIINTESRSYTDQGWKGIGKTNLPAITANLNNFRVLKPSYPAGFDPSDYGDITKCALVAPKITPDGGKFSGSVSVALQTTTSGSTIRYTLDGTTPTSTSPIYTGPFKITSSKTIKARAFKEDVYYKNPSAVSSALFTIGTPVPTSPSPPTGLKVK